MILNVNSNVDMIDMIIEHSVDFRDNTGAIADTLSMQFRVDRDKLLDYLNKYCEEDDRYITHALIDANESEYLEYAPKDKFDYEQYYIKEQDLTIIFENTLDSAGHRQRLRVCGMYFGEPEGMAFEEYKFSGADIDLRCGNWQDRTSSKYADLDKASDIAPNEPLGDIVLAYTDHILDEVHELESKVTADTCDTIKSYAKGIARIIKTQDK